MSKRYTSTLIDLRLQTQDVLQTREVQFIISSGSRDRHRTVVNPETWQLDNFNNNPIVGYQHNVYGDNMCVPPNPDDVMGPGRAWKDTIEGKKVIMGSVKFETEDINPLADKVFKKVMNASLRSTSVGFMELGEGKYGEGDQKKGSPNETYYYEGQELLEFSIVNIPSNVDARARSIRHHSDAALGYIARLIPQFSIEQIKEMKIQDIMRAIESGKTGIEDDDQIRLEQERLATLEKEKVKDWVAMHRDIHDMTLRNISK